MTASSKTQSNFFSTEATHVGEVPSVLGEHSYDSICRYLQAPDFQNIAACCSRKHSNVFSVIQETTGTCFSK